MKNRSSLSKNRGDTGVTPRHDTGVTPESSFDLARAVSKCDRVESIFAKAMLLQIVDRELSDKEFRIFCMIRACSFDGPIALSYDEIAMGGNCSERQAIRVCNKLAASGMIGVEYRRTRRNVFSASDSKTSNGSNRKTSKRRDGACLKCNAYRVLDAFEVCVVCRKQEHTEREVAEFLAESGPAPRQIVFLGLKANGSKASAKEIRRAYNKLTEAA